jgi:hypothetical protein
MVYTTLQYVDTDPSNLAVRAAAVAPSKEDLASITGQLGIDADQISQPSFDSPQFVRFGKGDLFFAQSSNETLSDGKNVIRFTFSGDNSSEAGLIRQELQKFSDKTETLEFLWGPQGGQFFRQAMGSTVGWTNAESLSVLKSFVRESYNRGSRETKLRAIAYASEWSLDLNAVNQSLPELYSFCDDDWRSPNFNVNENDASSLVDELKFLVRVNPGHERASVFATYNRISRYISGSLKAIRTAYEYSEGHSYTHDQFETLVALSEKLYTGFHEYSWDMAIGIAQRAGNDSAKASEMISIASALGSRGILDPTEPTQALDKLSSKITAGLSAANVDFYVRVFDSFKEQYRAGAAEDESACDRLVLSGKLSEGNLGAFGDFMGWLTGSAYQQFPDAVSAASGLRDFSGDTLGLFKSAYSWLTETVYINRGDALKKASTYLGNATFSAASLEQLKGYYGWLTETMYINRSDALSKAETALLSNGLTPTQIASIEDLASWMTETVYLQRPDALARAERLVVQEKVTSDDVQLLKDSLGWLVNTVYIDRNTAAAKVEAWIIGPNRLSRARFEDLKELTNWLIETIYLSKTDALARGERLILATSLGHDQLELYKDAASWMTETVYLNRSEAVTTTELYIVTNKMDRSLFAKLKDEYESLVEQGKNRNDALKKAAKDVLHAS